MFQIGIDMGGTFTDFVALSPQGTRLLKVPTTPADPLAAIWQGLGLLAGDQGLTLADYLGRTEKFVHGTTAAINALLQRKLAKTALLTTAGFRDAIEIRRSQLRDQWDLRAPLPPVLVPRHLRFGVGERIDSQGEVVLPLDLDRLAETAAALRREGVEAVACCLLFSFKNPCHEEAVKKFLQRQLPGVYISLSSEVAPKIKEYERTSTTVLNACLGPLVSRSLNRLAEELRAAGLAAPLFYMQNNGGLSDAAASKSLPVRMLMSGPAGGTVGGQVLGRLAGRRDLLIADMGGTSFDLSLVADGEISVAPEGEIEGYPLLLPMVHIHSVGAGGGSIASIDGGGILRVGPESAGADPGPACYGKGGLLPTVTDAALVLGLLDEDYFLGGSFPLNREEAAAALEKNVAVPLGIPLREAALAVYSVAASLMTDAAHLVTVQQGLDPADFTLVAAGGASPLFVCAIAAGLGIREIIVPAVSPVFCAQGMLAAGVRHDVVHSCLTGLKEENIAALNRAIGQAREAACAELSRQGITASRQTVRVQLEMKYEDQHHEISLHLPGGQLTSAASAADLFHHQHQRLFGFCQEEKPCLVVNIQVTAAERVPPAGPAIIAAGGKRGGDLPPVRQKTVLWDQELGEAPLQVLMADHLRPGEEIPGPALIQTPYTSILVTSAFQACQDRTGNLLLTAKGGSGHA